MLRETLLQVVHKPLVRGEYPANSPQPPSCFKPGLSSDPATEHPSWPTSVKPSSKPQSARVLVPGSF